jgi:hypothetical protein
MKIKTGLLEAAARIAFIGNSQLWADAKAFAYDAFHDTSLSNPERKEKVKQQLSLIFQDATSLLLNFAIEFAVILLVSKFPQFASIIEKSKPKL